MKSLVFLEVHEVLQNEVKCKKCSANCVFIDKEMVLFKENRKVCKEKVGSVQLQRSPEELFPVRNAPQRVASTSFSTFLLGQRFQDYDYDGSR